MKRHNDHINIANRDPIQNEPVDYDMAVDFVSYYDKILATRGSAFTYMKAYLTLLRNILFFNRSVHNVPID